MSPRILHLVHWLYVGGIEKWLIQAIADGLRAGVTMDVCCKGPEVGSLASDVWACGGQVHHLRQGLNPHRFQARLGELLRRESYDLLHVHTHSHAGPAVAAAKSAGIPAIATFHNSTHVADSGVYRLPGISQLRMLYVVHSIRYAVRHADMVTAVSSDTLQAVRDLTGEQLPEARVCYLGVEKTKQLTTSELQDLRLSLGLEATAKTVLHVGSFSWRKNHRVLLRAFALLRKKQPNAQLLLVGDGPLRSCIQRDISALGIASSVRMLGQRRDVQALMQLADCFLFPSITEGLSLAVMEALANRLPIVCSAAAGNLEASNNGRLAHIHECEDITGFAKTVAAILAGSSSAQRKTVEGAEFFQHNFSSSASNQRLHGLYGELLGKHERPQRKLAVA